MIESAGIILLGSSPLLLGFMAWVVGSYGPKFTEGRRA